FVPGYDMRAASYDVAAGGRYFLKVRLEPPRLAPLEVPRALLDAGVMNVLAPIPTVAASLWHPMVDGRSLVLYPFVAGRNAMVAGLPEEGWRAFGTAMRGVHDSGLHQRFADSLPAETFRLPSAAIVRDVLTQQPAVLSPAAARLQAFLDGHAGRIGAMLERAEALGAQLRLRTFDHVLCHADIHAANILVADDGRILLVDWDGPMLAPRERDLLFVIGSRIARRVEPHEEAWFFAGYGEVEVDHEAIVYYRHERILEDIGEAGRSVYVDHAVPETSRAAEVDMVESFFAPGADVDTVERRRPVARG
ncbi:MAG: aminoglycoside phosphotransferase family protein, partial [Chloroflexi bacterium]|nr:aminoglycoside phosphotransferase family protein [Chloroflexota bacterium]